MNTMLFQPVHHVSPVNAFVQRAKVSSGPMFFLVIDFKDERCEVRLAHQVEAKTLDTVADMN